MKKFKFSLEKVLDLKRAMREQRESQFRTASGEYQRQEQELEVLKNTLREWKSLGCVAKIEAGRLRHLESAIQHLDAAIERRTREMEAAAERLNRLRNLFLKSKRQQEVLEKIKEKRFSRFQYEIGVEAQKEIDDSAISAHIRRA